MIPNKKFYSRRLFMVVAVVALATFSFVYAAWQEPSDTPPGGNVEAPLNVGNSLQWKIGSLRLGGLTVDAGTILARNSGMVTIGNVGALPVGIKFYIPSGKASFMDNVGIGTTSPQHKLSVDGGNAYFSGDIGIGTAPTNFRLDVNGVMRLWPSSAPATPLNGVIYYDSAKKSFRCYQDNVWIDNCFGGGGGGGAIDGSGTKNRIAKFTGINTIGNSQITETDDGTQVWIASGWGTSAVIGPIHIDETRLSVTNDQGDKMLALYRAGVPSATFPVLFKAGSDNALVINAGDADVLTIKDNKVGIGTTSPEARLDIESGSIMGQGWTSLSQWNPPNNIADAEFITYKAGINNWGGFGVYPNGGMWFRGESISFWTPSINANPPTNVIHMDAFGNLGIGTTAPTQKLYVSGNIYATGNITCGGSCGGVSQWTVSGNNIYNSNSGNVGIGTLAPTNKLTIQSSFPQIGLWGPGNAWALGAGANAFVIQNTTNGAFQLWIANNGNVGIGTTTPSEKLHVNGNILTPSKLGFNNDIANYYIGGISNGLEYKAFSIGNFTFTSGSGNWIFTNGNVGIGKTPISGYKLDVAGRINGTELCIAGNCLSAWPSDGFTIKREVMATTAPGGILLAGCPDTSYRRIACSGGLIHTGNESNEDNEAFIVRPSLDDYTCEIEWEDDPVGGKQVEVYAYCMKK